MLAPWKKSYDQPRQHIKKQRHYFANKGQCSQGYGFSSSHVRMWEFDYKESQVPKNWCFWTAVLEKTLDSPLDFKEIQPVHPKGNQSWIFTGRTDAEAETSILWPPDAKKWLTGKDTDAGKDCWQEEEDRGWDGWMASPTRWTWVWINSRSWWCYLTILSSAAPFSSCLQSCPASGSFPMSQIFTSDGQSIGASASATVLPINIQDWFSLGLIGLISLKSKGLSRVFPSTIRIFI